MNDTVLHSAADVIETLGGLTKVARLFGVSPQRVNNWRKNGLPPNTRDAFTALLTLRGLTVPGHVFGQLRLPGDEEAACPSPATSRNLMAQGGQS